MAITVALLPAWLGRCYAHRTGGRGSTESLRTQKCPCSQPHFCVSRVGSRGPEMGPRQRVVELESGPASVRQDDDDDATEEGA